MDKKGATTSWIIWIIVFAIIVGGLYWMTQPKEGVVNENVAKCIGNNSKLYVQLGCTHCETQERMFGTSYQYLNVTDCFYNRQACIDAGITGTPTWVIRGEKYVGVQSIDRLKSLTTCELE